MSKQNLLICFRHEYSENKFVRGVCSKYYNCDFSFFVLIKMCIWRKCKIQWILSDRSHISGTWSSEFLCTNLWMIDRAILVDKWMLPSCKSMLSLVSMTILISVNYFLAWFSRGEFLEHRCVIVEEVYVVRFSCCCSTFQYPVAIVVIFVKLMKHLHNFLCFWRNTCYD